MGYSPRMPEKSKKGLIVVALIVVVIGAITWPHLQWFRFELEARDAFNDKTGLGRFPSPDQIVGVKKVLQEKAAAKGFETLSVSVAMEQRSMGPVKFWFVKAAMSSGSHSFENERRVETALGPTELEFLQENGVSVPH